MFNGRKIKEISFHRFTLLVKQEPVRGDRGRLERSWEYEESGERCKYCTECANKLIREAGLGCRSF